MAQLLNLADYPRRHRRPAEDVAGEGRILIFTGVRYERRADAQTEPADDHPARRRRRRG
jgi:hypothetical protein